MVGRNAMLKRNGSYFFGSCEGLFAGFCCVDILQERDDFWKLNRLQLCLVGGNVVLRKEKASFWKLWGSLSEGFCRREIEKKCIDTSCLFLWWYFEAVGCPSIRLEGDSLFWSSCGRFKWRVWIFVLEQLAVWLSRGFGKCLEISLGLVRLLVLQYLAYESHLTWKMQHHQSFFSIHSSTFKTSHRLHFDILVFSLSRTREDQALSHFLLLQVILSIFLIFLLIYATISFLVTK